MEPIYVTSIFSTAYHAAKMTLSVLSRDLYDQGGNSDYEKVVPTERDNDFFLQAWKTAASTVADLIRDHITEFNVYEDEEDGMEADFGVMSYSKTYTATDIAIDFGDYIRNSMLNEWLTMKAPANAEPYAKAMEAASAGLKLKVCHKPRPKLKYFN